MKTILPTTFAVTLLSGAALLATTFLAGPADGQTSPAGSLEGKAEAAENNAAHVLNNAGSGGASGSTNASMAGKPSVPTAGSASGDANIAAKKPQHAMGEGNSGANSAQAPIAK